MSRCCWGRADPADQNQKALEGTSLLRICGCMDWCSHLYIPALHSLNFIGKDTAGKRELLESNVTFVVIVCGMGQKAKELLVIEKKNIRNYRDWANKSQPRVGQVHAYCSRIWLVTPSKALPALSLAIATPVCCRKTNFSASHTGISFLSHPSVQDPRQQRGCSHSAWSSCRLGVQWS